MHMCVPPHLDLRYCIYSMSSMVGSPSPPLSSSSFLLLLPPPGLPVVGCKTNPLSLTQTMLTRLRTSHREPVYIHKLYTCNSKLGGRAKKEAEGGWGQIIHISGSNAQINSISSVQYREHKYSMSYICMYPY